MTDSNVQYVPKRKGWKEVVYRYFRYLYYRPYILQIKKLQRGGGASSTFLEVGVGPGYFLNSISRMVENVKLIGVDVEPELVEYSKSVVVADYFVCDAMELPSENGVCDGVVSFQVVEHLSSPEKFFLEAYRVLKNDGIIVFTTPNTIGFGANILGDKWGGVRPDHISLMPPSEWRKLVEFAGFEVVLEGSTFFNGLPYIGRGVLAIPFYLLQVAMGWLPWLKGESYVMFARKKEL